MTKADLMELWDDMQRGLYLQARDWLHHDEDAEDAVQDTFVRVWRNRDGLDSDQNVRGYIRTALSSVLKNKYRSRTRAREVEWPSDEDENLIPLGQTEPRDAEQALTAEAVLVDMTPEIRRTVLSFGRGAKVRELMDREGRAKSTIMRRLAKGRAMLRGATA